MTLVINDSRPTFLTITLVEKTVPFNLQSLFSKGLVRVAKYPNLVSSKLVFNMEKIIASFSHVRVKGTNSALA